MRGWRENAAPAIVHAIAHSPDQSRLVAFGSSGFLSDAAMRIVGQSIGGRYDASARLAQNAVDWSVQDAGLLAVRRGSRFTRLLRPVSDGTRLAIEPMNHAATHRRRKRHAASRARRRRRAARAGRRVSR
jgi:ABC-2 type transport system permease protein